MSKVEKLIQKIFAQQQISYKDAEKYCLSLDIRLKPVAPMLCLERLVLDTLL